jgi:hypothetical protein
MSGVHLYGGNHVGTALSTDRAFTNIDSFASQIIGKQYIREAKLGEADQAHRVEVNARRSATVLAFANPPIPVTRGVTRISCLKKQLIRRPLSSLTPPMQLD